jgi:hypothetical protein
LSRNSFVTTFTKEKLQPFVLKSNDHKKSIVN